MQAANPATAVMPRKGGSILIRDIYSIVRRLNRERGVAIDRQQIAAIGARKAGLSTNPVPFARSVARNEESVTNAG